MMHDAAVLVFWASIAAVLYVYVGYPLSLRALPRLRPAGGPPREAPPRVSVLIAAHNEERTIAATLENKLDLDYPPDRVEIIVVSDGSTDATDEILQSFAARGVRWFRQSPRQGKTTALNLARGHASGEIIVFCDANSIYDRLALRRLVEAFDDPRVGYATGRLLYLNPGQSPAGAGCGAFMRYENLLRRLETRVGSIVGVNGGIDAVRAALFKPMRADQLPDFVLPLSVVEQGFRVVFRPEAVAYEEALQGGRDEFRMRVRVSLRAYHALAEMKQLLAPRFGLFAFQLLVHKLLRYGVFIFLIAALATNLLLLGRPFFRAALAAQAACYALAGLGLLLPRRLARGPLLFPSYFVLTNAASAVAFVKFFQGQRLATWTPRKGA